MDRRLVIPAMFLVLAVLCLLLVGLSSAMRAGGSARREPPRRRSRTWHPCPHRWSPQAP